MALEVTETLAIKQGSDGPYYCCKNCSASLGPVSESYKSSCVSEEVPVVRATPTAGDPKRFVDADPVFRQFVCPSCGTLIENEVTIAGSAPLSDLEYSPDAIASHLADRTPAE
ncbi:MAG: acetone carboxylase subunit gamma [Hyphomicrobiaceae bacterium]